MSNTHGTGYNGVRVLTIGIMVSLAILAWLASLSFAETTMTMSTRNMQGNPPIMTMSAFFDSPSLGSVTFFILVWVTGMVAMMFPAMIPVVAIYTGFLTKSVSRRAVQFIASIILFLGGYLLLYAMLGVAVFAVISLVFYLTGLAPSLSAYAIPVASGVLFVSGGWQLTPLKDRCLSRCISPLGFFLTHTKKGLAGAFRMGAEHGYYCLGCCYMYMLVMVGVAAMSIHSMILLSSLIIIEKTVAKGAVWFKWISAGIFMTLGILLIISPGFLNFI